jgi:hypothetical protein
VDLSALKPDKAIIHLNKVTEGRPVFCLPSIEGVGTPLTSLAGKIPLPVYCVQAVPAAPQDSIEKLAAFYSQVSMPDILCSRTLFSRLKLVSTANRGK